MTIGSILLGVALLLLVALFISRPLWQPHTVPPVLELTPRQALEAQKDVILDQIRALDFDLETGKIPAAIHEQQRPRLVAEASELLKQIDALDQAAGIAGRPAGGEAADEYRLAHRDDEIERAIALMREKRAAGEGAVLATAARPAVDDDIEQAIAQVRAARSPEKPGASAATAPTATAAVIAQPTMARFCPQCGQPRESQDKFCAFCGRSF